MLCIILYDRSKKWVQGQTGQIKVFCFLRVLVIQKKIKIKKKEKRKKAGAVQLWQQEKKGVRGR